MPSTIAGGRLASTSWRDHTSPPRERLLELNAFASDDFIKRIESKLDEQGVKKVVPKDDTLTAAYARAVKVVVIKKAIQGSIEEAEEVAEMHTMPKSLGKTIRKRLADNSDWAWDHIVATEARTVVDD